MKEKILNYGRGGCSKKVSSTRKIQIWRSLTHPYFTELFLKLLNYPKMFLFLSWTNLLWVWPVNGHLRIRGFDFFVFIRAMVKETWLDAVFRADYEYDLKNKFKLNFHNESSSLQHFQLLNLLFRSSNPFKKILKTIPSDRESNSLQYDIFVFMFECKRSFYVFKKSFGSCFVCNFVPI